MTRRKGATKVLAEAAEALTQESIVRSKALVFISHDSRDADLSEAFANLLSDVSAGTLKSFRSSDKKGTSGIEFGTEWYKAIMLQLGDATDVVALLTQRSIDRPWILYEAGVAKGKLDTNVLGVALGVPLEKVSTGPFGQFQNCGDDEDSLTKLVIQLLQRNPEAAPREEAIRRQVQAFRQIANELLSAKGKAIVPSQEESGPAKLFEEVKAMIRELPDRISNRDRIASRHGLRRLRRLHPGMLEELLFHPAMRESKQGSATAWLLFISLLRDDMPWVYEAGMELYRALRSGNASEIEEAKDRFVQLIEIISRGPFFREVMRPDDEETFFMVRHLAPMVDHFVTMVGHEERSRGKARVSQKKDVSGKSES
jgi:hypothetical protein